jgi:hypothetical protein
MPFEGSYRFRVLATDAGHNPGTGTESFKTRLEVVASEGPNANAEGDKCVAVFLTSGKGGPSGLARVKRFVMFAAGYENDDTYDEFDPEGDFIDACEAGGEESPLAGRFVECDVQRGRSRDDGDYYREYAWSLVPEGEQEVAIPTEDDGVPIK